MRLTDLLPDIIFYFNCCDATAVLRQVGRAQCLTDCADKSQERMRTFHRLDKLSVIQESWFPGFTITEVEAELPATAVSDSAVAHIDKLLCCSCWLYVLLQPTSLWQQQ